MLNFIKMPMNKKFSYLWDSPTFTTWGSFLTRTASIVLVLPLVLNRFNVHEITVWYLFSTIVGMQMLADIGFSPTFSRVIAFAMGGATRLKDLRDIDTTSNSGEPNWDIIAKIYSTMKAIYLRLILLLIVLLAIAGTLALIKPISALDDQQGAWIAWVIVIITSAIALWGNTYVSYLQGVNKIALFRRWETITSIGSIFTSFVVLFLGGRLLALVIATQVWMVISVLRNRFLSRQVEGGRFAGFTGIKIDQGIFDATWPSAWRSGLGVFMSAGLIQASGLIYAQVGSAASVASYLLALRFIQSISLFSQAPFYSKLPMLAKLRAEGNLGEQVKLAKRGMQLSYWTYVIGFIGVGLMADNLLKYIGSNAEFVEPLLWSIMGLAFFVERYGAMHIQLYSTTNHIIWHIANGITGLIYMVISLALLSSIGVYAFPVAILVSYLGFYSWYSAKHSYRAFNLSFLRFEKATVFVPLLFIVSYLIWTNGLLRINF